MKILGSRRFSSAIVLALVAAWLLVSITVRAQTTATYEWEYPWCYVGSVATQCDATSLASDSVAGPLITRLQTEVQRILDTGRPGGTYGGLGIGEYQHNDQGQSDQGMQRWVYVKPGRTIATLAWAYPFLTASQKTSAVAYVQAELGSSTFQPWQTTQLGTGSGNAREFYPHTTRTFATYANYPTYEPAAEQMYGLWLWGWRKGQNWSDLTTGQASIRTWYTNTVSSQSDFYGGMSVHIGKARLESAQVWNNSGNLTTAQNNLSTALTNNLAFNTVEGAIDNCTTGRFRFHYCAGGGTTNSRRMGGQYLGWPFYGVSPEIARYIGAETFTGTGVDGRTIAQRTAYGKTQYPLWFLRRAGYDNGDACGSEANCEGAAISPETICMIAPLEMFSAAANAGTMANYAKSGPTMVGDHCWIELLVYAIEAQGSRSWVDVRNGHP